jgi:hypothetical protein
LTLLKEKKMPNAKDVTVETEYIKVMGVGEPGTGKSIFGSTFPTPGFVFDFANSIISYKGLDFDYEQYPLSPQGWTTFEKDVMRIGKDVKEGKYVTVIVDDLSAMTAVCMERALQLDSKRSVTGGPVWNVHYSMVRNLMEGRLKQIMSWPCNIYFIAHLHVIQDQETGVITGVEPMLTGALPGVITGYFDEVYYFTTKREGGDTKWLIQTVPIGYNRARSRTSGKLRTLPDLLPNDYKEVMAYLTGKKIKEKKQTTTTHK